MTNGNFLISVIIPVFNGEKYLGEAIESVLVQTLKPLEIIVIDDGSEDYTYKVANKYARHIKFYRQPRSGVGSARNRGIKLARCNFIAHLDHDDLWEKHKLWVQLEAFQKNNDLEIVGCLMKSFYSSELSPEEKEKVFCPLDPMPSFSASAILVKKNAYHRIGFYMEGINKSSDLDWFIRAREAGIKEKMINKVLCYRRIHKSNTGLRNPDILKEKLCLLRAKIQRQRNKKHNEK